VSVGEERCHLSFRLPRSLRVALRQELARQERPPSLNDLVCEWARMWLLDMANARAAGDPRLAPPREEPRPQSRPRERKPRPQRRGGKRKGVSDGEG